MVRSSVLALFAVPVTLAIACGSDESGPKGGEGGAATEGGAGGTPEGDAGHGADAGSPASTGGRDGTGGSTTGGASTGGASTGGEPTGGASGGTATTGGAATGGNETGGVGGEGEGGEGGSSAGAGGSGGQAVEEIEITVTTNADVHAISPLIYGVNPAYGVSCSNAAARFTLCRLGGNRWSTYNWENNASNDGSDSPPGCTENNAALGASDTPAATVTSLIDEAGQKAAAAVVTVPMLDYVAADKMAGEPYPLCTGDITDSPDYLSTRLRNNRARKGAAFADPPDVTDAYVSQDEFLSYVKSRAGTTKVLLTLDNQPELWGQTHQALHPAQTTYTEVVARNTDYAKMIRENWPGAEISGYGGYGWQAFDNLQNAPDNDGINFLDYYLAAMKVASTTADERLIDYLDVHWYSVIHSPTPETRVQAPRSLWDSTYVESSWIGENNGAIRLIPWIMGKITTYYPGTKLAISSYAYGGVDEISGGVAVADVLGIFGREGVSMAAIEPEEGANDFSVAAFAAFRNYDGAGASFGDQSVRAVSSDVAKVSVYASTDSQAAGKVVIIAINRSSTPSPVRLTLEDSGNFTSADVYVLSEVAPEVRAAAPVLADGANLFPTTLPAYSVSVIVPKP